MSEEETNRQHAEIDAKERLDEQKTEKDLQIRCCIPYDIKFRSLLYDIIIETEIDLEVCSKDSSMYKGRIESQRKNLDIAKRILEKCKLEEIYLTHEERSWLLRYLKEAKDKIWYFIAEEEGGNDKHKRFVHHRFRSTDLYTVHEYLKIIDPDYCLWGNDVSLEWSKCHKCRGKAEVIYRYEPHKPIAYCKRCKDELNIKMTNKHLETTTAARPRTSKVSPEQYPKTSYT